MSEPNKPTTVPSVHDIVHTPGPWIVSPYAKNLVATADDKIGIADVAMCAPWIAKPPQEQQDANAILMSAAPDLLAALRAIRAELCRRHSPFVVEMEYAYINEAIGKATGKAV